MQSARRKRQLKLLVVAMGVLATACASSGPKSGDLTMWCAAQKQLREVDPTAKDSAQLRANVVELRSATKDSVRTAPDEVKEPARVIGDRFPKFLDQVEAADYDISKVDVDAFFNDSEVSQAGQRLDTFYDKHCEE